MQSKKNKSILVDYYQKKALDYNISTGRLNKILELLKYSRHLRILDVGCATGFLGEKLRKQGNFVVGIDISEKAIQKAKKYLDEVYALNIETDPLPKLPKFDLIIMSEIIEHLFQPEESLKKIAKFLKIGGKLLITTPNILYWGNRFQFLTGKFEYTDQGHFDKSHIHFFSYKTLINLIKQIGLTVIAENHVVQGSISQMLVKHKPGMFAYQFVILTKKIN